jgi:GT2 family glycosyltransferase/glycosyltransferase involved in cell wall biosynthesis
MTSLWFMIKFLGAFMSQPFEIFRDYRALRRSKIIDPRYYVTTLPANQQWLAARIPVLHYLIVGEGLNVSANPLFILEYYRPQLQESPNHINLLAHYTRFGSFQGIRPNPYFSNFYLEQCHDVLGSGQHPLAHYYWHGWKELRNPHPAFDTQGYMQAHGISTSSLVHPLAHFLSRDLETPSELWGLMPGESCRDPSPVNVKISESLKADLIVPVYRRPDCVENLFEGLMKSRDWANVSSCIVVDDCGDTFTSSYLSQLPKRSEKITIIKNDQNVGFLRSVNTAYAQTNASFVVLVNSDIQVPENWLSRLLAPFEQDQKIALATPLATSGANLSVALRPGQSWIDGDKLISADKPSYPDACTGIGYLMAIRKAAIKTEKLFDEVFQHGYGEDTDLHYRLVSAGWRSVVCDNVLVLHRGSASYLLDDQKSKIYEANRKIFFDRWGDLHKSCHERYLREKPLERILTAAGHTRKEQVDESIDVLFVAPTNNRSIGGVRVIFEMAAFLAEHGVKAKIYCTEQTAPVCDHAHDYLMPIFLEKNLKRLVKSVKVIVGTGIGVAGKASEFASFYGSKRWWLVQGPECYFGDGRLYQTFIREVTSAEHVITVSSYLTKLVSDFGCNSITTLPLGPDQLVFYPRDVAREPHSMAIHLIGTPDKGSRFAVSFAEAAKRRGMNVHLFGSNTLLNALPKDLGTWHGKLDSDGLAKLFSRCEYYLDLSLMEGLGLLPLEAYLCGCKPVLTKKGGPDLILQGKPGVIWLDSHLDYDGCLDKIFGAGVANTTTSTHNLQVATRDAYQQLLKIF